MKVPPYPCAYCGRRGRPHPFSYEARCVDCAGNDEHERLLRADIVKVATVLVLVLALALIFVVWLYARMANP